MSTTTLLPLLLLLLLAASTSARPCKTIFFFSSTSYYTLPQNPNPNPNQHFLTLYLTSTSTSNSLNPNPNPHRFFLIPRPFSSRLIFHPIHQDQEQSFQKIRSFSNPIEKIESFSDLGREDEHPVKKIESFDDLYGLPSRVYSSVKDSMKDRSRDIMSVVGALLFGMGCGALTAAVMYLVWSLFMPNRFEFEDSDDEGFDSFDDLYNPKKMAMAKGGYVAIPSKVVDDQELKKGVDGNVLGQGA